MAKAVSRLGRGLGSLIAGGTPPTEEPSTLSPVPLQLR